MASETQTLTGRCATHGTVVATRQLPRTTFPFVITAVSRVVAERRRPYLCPACSEPVTTE